MINDNCNSPFETLSQEETAEMLGVRTSTLASWRSSGKYGLKYIKIGKKITYMKKDVKEFIESCKIIPKNKIIR